MQILKWIPPDARLVIEFGCGKGELAEKFKQVNPSCRYIGIEINEEAAKEALKWADQVWIARFDEIDLKKYGILQQQVDCMICHVDKNWQNVNLKQFDKYVDFLKPGGQVVINMLNGRYIRSVMSQLERTNLLDTGCSLEQVQQALMSVGFYIYDVKIFRSKQDEELRKNMRFLQSLQSLVEFLHLQAVSKEIWDKEYLIRAVKGPLPKQLLLHSLLGETKVCSRVRIVEPHGFCETIPGVKVKNEAFTANLSFGMDYSRKVFIRQRIWSELPTAREELKNLVQRGYLIISEMDDDPEHWENLRRDHYFAFRGCHAVQTSTPALADFLRQYNPNVAVFANQLAMVPPPRVYDEAGPVQLFFGALNREKDWQPILPELNAVLQTCCQGVFVRVIHDKKFFDLLETRQKEFVPFCDYGSYSRILHACDIALLPLENTKFNQRKSDLKFLECAAHGVTVIASPTVYEATLMHGVNGLIYNNPAEFRLFLTQLIEEKAVRRRIASNAYQYVCEERLLWRHYKERYRWYEALIDRLPELTCSMMERIREYS